MKEFNPNHIIIAFGEVLLRGYAEDEFVTVEHTSDAFTKATGAQGDTVRIKTNDESGTVTVTLLASSAANGELSLIAAADRAAGGLRAGVRPIFVKDLNLTTLCSGGEAWIRKVPTVSYSRGVPVREWIFDVAKLDMTLAGALL